MKEQQAIPADKPLLSDLVDGLSVTGRDPTLSVGIVGCGNHPPQPPAHCLRVCLGGDAGTVGSHGCAFLAAAAENRIDRSCLHGGRCPKGFQVAAQQSGIAGEPATLVTVEGQCGADAAIVGEVDLLGHLNAASRLVQRFDQLLAENAGFANEVLQNYEQLNLIFDLTQQIAQVTDARTIESLLLKRVGRLLSAAAVRVVHHDDEVYILDSNGQPNPSAEDTFDNMPALMEAVAFVRQSRQVHVGHSEGYHLIAGPLVRLDDRVDVVIAHRESAAGVFHSGDMMLVESVLAFGGQIISNTELHERMRRMSLEVTRAMVAAIDKKDHYTSGHSERGGFLTRLTAAELGVPPMEQQYMEWAGLLHDVGKIGIPEEILCKPGKLTPEEFEVIKQHPRMGYEILQPIASLGVVLDGVLHHHEYPDGSGYPDGLKGDEIPLVARIVHVVDTFDALTSTRSYRRAFSIEKAIEIIRSEKGVRIDAEVAEAFIGAFERYRRENPADFHERFCRDPSDAEEAGDGRA